MTDGDAFDRLEQELDFIFYDSRAQCIGQRAEFADVNNHCRNGKAPLFTESDSTGIAITHLGDNLDRRIPSSEVFQEWWEEQMKVIHEQRTNSLFLMQSQDSVEDMETTMRIWRKPDHRNYAVRERVKKCELKKMPPLSDIDRDIIQMELKQPTILPPHLSLAEHFNVSYGNVFTKEKAQSSEPSMNNIKYLHAALHSLASGTHGSSAISLSDLDLKKSGSFGDIQLRRKIGGQTEYWPNTPNHQRNNNIHLATQNSPLEKTLLRNSHVPIDGYKDSTKKNVPLFSPSRMNLTEKEREYLLNRQSSNVNSANAGYATPTSIEDFSRLYNSAKQPDNNMIRRLAYNAKDRLIAGATNEKNLGRKRNQFEEGFQHPIFNQVYEQYLQRSNLTNSDGLLYQKACADALLSQNQLQYVNECQTNDLSSQRRNALRSSENISNFPSLMKIPTVGSSRSFNPENDFASTFMECLGNKKTGNFGNLSEILGRIVHLSLDQNGSRFIQEKLKTASVEEINLMFSEIIHHARELMTDVFGNYVIQKFFDFGSKHQTNQLANQLTGHVLRLSFHMYGCRIVQKALLIVELDQKIRLISELEGSVLKCICDQNGNHVIQKCIECLPQENIKFITSSVTANIGTLAVHPYGCRVIQRVLEFCNDENTHRKLMDAILESASTLAIDQFGNYVMQVCHASTNHKWKKFM